MKPPVAAWPIASPLPECVSSNPFDFVLPAELEAGAPPEARGLARDQVRLLVSHYTSGQIAHTQFRNLPDYFEPGDLLVINTSGTLKAALAATRYNGEPLVLHLSTHLPADLWVVELRQPEGAETKPFLAAIPGETIHLPGGGFARLHTPYDSFQRAALADSGQLPENRPPVRLWIATLFLPDPIEPYLERYGFPIRYKYVREAWPISYYQTVYANEPGSTEMPSAGRAFTSALITQLAAKGIQIAPLVLHTGVASLEAGEPPYEEYYRVPAATARAVNAARAAGKRVVAVGTTVARALETASEPDGLAHPGQGWTDLVVTAERGLHAVTALLTGFHEPQATHLEMLAALAGYEHLRSVYQEAIAKGYLWHEFGDLHLILP